MAIFEVRNGEADPAVHSYMSLTQCTEALALSPSTDNCRLFAVIDREVSTVRCRIDAKSLQNSLDNVEISSYDADRVAKFEPTLLARLRAQ